MRKGKKIEDKWLLLAGVVFLCIFLAGGYFLLDYYGESRKQSALNKELAQLAHGKGEGFVYVEAIPIVPGNNVAGENTVTSDIHTTVNPENTEETVQGADGEQETTETFSRLAELNPDYLCWIQMADTPIDYPVVHKDNSFYLRRDFYGEKNRHGTIFMDELCDAEDDFLLFHGHNMKDGTMFGCLKNLKKKSYRTEHMELTLNWAQEEEQFEIFAGALIDLYDKDRFRYEVLPKAKETTEEYLAELKKVALWYEDITWEEGDRVLILSTCDYGTEEQRFIIVCIEK